MACHQAADVERALGRPSAARRQLLEARENVVSVLARLEALDAAVPAISIPKEPAEAIEAHDERARELDANVLALLESVRDVGSGRATAAVAERVETTAAAIDALSARLLDSRTRLDDLCERIASRAASTRTALTLASVVAALVCLYGTLLHAVLYGWGRHARRRVPGTGGGPPASRGMHDL